MVVVAEEIDLTLSDDDSGEEEGRGNARQLPLEAPTVSPVVTPIKCKSEPATQPTAAGNDNYGGGGVDVDEDGLKPAITGGKGLWSLWTRNFKSPLLMLLDLVDNAVDAAMQREEEDDDSNNEFTSRVQIYRDIGVTPDQGSVTTGLCIRNNSPKKIAPLKEVLQLFISAKADSGSNSIGENGVGLKQSCAALSDLSFVLLKNGETKFELGILAKALQRDDMVILPCFEFEEGRGGRTIKEQMLELFAKPQYQELAKCIADYGRVHFESNPSIAQGVARLGKHFDDMHLNFFGNSYVFEVIINKVAHHEGNETTVTQNAAVRDMINELQHETSRRFLHIPDSFRFSVGKKELTFKYWGERLVEFTSIEIPVRSKIPFYEKFGDETEDSYYLQVYLGFDRYRIAGKDANTKKVCSLYVYSRASGRMIQYEQDARTILGLTAGGSAYCQALTVIIDDAGGRLPLDPCKQGIAFGNKKHGHVHRDNLYATVGAVARFYYTYHLNKFDGKKTILSSKITEFVNSEELPENIKTCGKNADLTDYEVRFVKTKGNRLMVDHTCFINEEVGPDTIFRLLPETQNGRKAPRGKASPSKKKQRSKASAKKKQSTADKASKLPPKRKKLAAQANKPTNTKRRRTRHATEVSQQGNKRVKKTKTGEISQAESQGTIIDLCSSSDEDEQSMDGTPQVRRCLRSNFASMKDEEDTADDTRHEAEEEEKGEARVNNLKIENAELKTRVASLEAENNSLEKEVKRLSDELEQCKSKPNA